MAVFATTTQKQSRQSAPSHTPHDAVTCVNSDYCTRLAARGRGALPFNTLPVGSTTNCSASCIRASLRFPPTDGSRSGWETHGEKETGIAAEGLQCASQTRSLSISSCYVCMHRRQACVLHTDNIFTLVISSYNTTHLYQ